MSKIFNNDQRSKEAKDLFGRIWRVLYGHRVYMDENDVYDCINIASTFSFDEFSNYSAQGDDRSAQALANLKCNADRSRLNYDLPEEAHEWYKKIQRIHFNNGLSEPWKSMADINSGFPIVKWVVLGALALLFVYF